MNIYAGIGSRSTPKDILLIMTKIAQQLSNKGWILRSGGALGADSAFEAGANMVYPIRKEIYTTKDIIDNAISREAIDIASEFHPAWHKLSNYVKKLHARNAMQILGANLDLPVSCVICWTPDGCTNHSTRSMITGGTGTAISIADAHNIPVFNLKIENHLNIIRKRLEV